MGLKKGLPPYAKKTEKTKDVRPRLEILEEVLMLTAPKWNGKKYTKSMTLKEACDKVGISDMTLRNWRQENPKLNDYFNSVVKSRKEMTHSMMETAALQNVMEGIGGGVKLRPLDKINISLRYLEKTSEEFNPSLKLDVDSKNTINIGMGQDEMIQRIMELSSALGITNPIDNEGQGSMASSSGTTTDTEESTSGGEV